MPRILRLLNKGESTFYHVTQRTASDGYPLDDIKKDYLLDTIKRFGKLYFADILGFTVRVEPRLIQTILSLIYFNERIGYQSSVLPLCILNIGTKNIIDTGLVTGSHRFEKIDDILIITDSDRFFRRRKSNSDLFKNLRFYLIGLKNPDTSVFYLL